MFGASHSQNSRTVPVLVAVCLFAVPVHAKYSGGSGTAQDPYQIATAADLIALGETPVDYDKHFILTADIDLDPNLPGRKVFDRALIAPDINETNEWWNFDGTPFAGVFDGNGHTIAHLTIRGAGYLGLFGSLHPGGRISRLVVSNVNISGSGDFVAGLVGSNALYSGGEGGALSQCHSTGAVSGNSRVGRFDPSPESSAIDEVRMSL